MASTYLITGATGFVGSHLVEECARRGFPVRALVRAGSDTSHLERHQATVVRGDLTDADAVRRALEGADVVLHTAAKVGDWGPVEDYRAVNVEALRGLLEACRGRPLQRFVHFSSLGVYAARHHHGTDESEPLPERQRDGYTQSKVEAEQLALQYYRDFGVPVVVLRPGFVYGPRDRTVMPRMIENLRLGRVRYPGARGKRALNTIFVGNLVQAVFLALENDRAVGQIYNLTDGEFVSKRRFVEAVADAMGLPRPTRCPPLWLARFLTWCAEGLAKMRGAREAPLYTRARLKFLGLNLDFSIEKVRRELGYQPRTNFDDAMYETMAYYKKQAQGPS